MKAVRSIRANPDFRATWLRGLGPQSPRPRDNPGDQIGNHD